MKYLEQILVALRQTHLIRGIKGFKGGYVIARPADKISFQEIIDALDITILGDADTGGAEDTSLLKATVQECLWDQMTAYLRQFCSSITLQDMMDRYRNSIPQDEAFMYYIYGKADSGIRRHQKRFLVNRLIFARKIMYFLF